MRRSDDHDAGEGNGLENAERHIAGARRYINEQIIHIPQNVCPELLNNAADDRTAPDDGIRLVVEQEVDGHDLDAGRTEAGQKRVLRADGLVVYAEGFGNGWTGDIGVQNADAVSLAAQADGKLAGDHRFTDAAFSGDNAEHLADVRVRVVRL